MPKAFLLARSASSLRVFRKSALSAAVQSCQTNAQPVRHFALRQWSTSRWRFAEFGQEFDDIRLREPKTVPLPGGYLGANRRDEIQGPQRAQDPRRSITP